MRVEGDPVEGARLRVSPGPEAEGLPTFTPRVLAVRPEREFRWLGHLFVNGLYDGEHAFLLERLDGDRTRLVQTDTFTGLLVPLVNHFYREDTRAGFESANAALKARAEALAADRATTV